MSSEPLVSIVVPTLNAEKNIEKCLKSIRNQTYKNIELIIVDNFSRDKTAYLAKKYTAKVFNHGSERSAQRNYGVSKSKGLFVSWFDVDMILEPDVIKDCVDKISKNNNLAALVIPERSIGKGFWAKCKALEKECYLGDERMESIRFIKKSVFNKVGRLSENLISGEDWDVTTRVRQSDYLIGRIRCFVNHDEGKLSFVKDLKKKFYYATKSLPYIDKHINSPKDVVLFVVRPAFLKNWRLLLKNPIVTIGLLFMKFSEFFVGLLGLIYAKLITSNFFYFLRKEFIHEKR